MSEVDALPPGLPRLINERYEIESLIGRGGMADVYLATDHVLSRKVAVKVLRPDTASNPMVVNRFRREAKAVAALGHPNIVAVYDTGELPATDQQRERLPFMVMEYVTGKTLKQVIAQGGIQPEFAVRITRGVAEALGHSHANNVVHRDVKPANVMVSDAGHVKLMDFGIARATDNSATMTQTAAVVGTAQYFSPEQARGEQVDFRSDIYSTGCLFYELMTGRPPFTGDSPVSVAYQHVGEIATAPSDVNQDLDPIYDPIVAKVLAKDRADRFQSVDAFATALENALHGIEFHEDQAQATPYTLPIYGIHDNTEAGFAAASAPMTNEHPVFTSEHEPVQTTRHKSNRALIILLSLIALLAVAVASFLVVRSIQADQEKNAPVAVPDVKNMSEDDASSLLRDATFNVKVEHEFDEDVDTNKATRTDPTSGTEVAKESTITLYLSKGSEQREIPDNLANQSEATARDALSEAGLEVGKITRENSATVDTDRIIETNPELGSKVKAGSKVDLILSTGQVEVPDLVGMTLDEAERELDDKGLVELSIDSSAPAVETDEVSPDEIAIQTPDESATIDQSGSISVILAKAPAEPSPSESETPSPSDSEEPSESDSEDPSEDPTETPSETPSESASESPSDSPKSTKGPKQGKPLPSPGKPGEGNRF
ncbi:Stk1 family PASTA domain-containing Ser/Thr kinase [Arthrobacter sp. S41]|uniref:Stk1 family PASTA domain-containing Ser/Thr kinase n=1 Tax=Arthrobacter sp. S41 TaxID=2509721 RepID=UPI0010366D86|nr:Stk1 family PASTA domain-containing Ser/Thr kinase [Arthrobacter sp. S41]TAP28766.1 Stk1 family PASTA domain-containing Ser/Thr kinase [Arthrobacter sp. S41]